MKKNIGFLALAAAFSMVFPTYFHMANAKDITGHEDPTSIIFMVPDGMGLSNVTAARIFKHGPDGDHLSFETLENIGYQSTHSANSTVTDSGAAASAWAVGEKFNNGEISCHDENKDGICENEIPTILELAGVKGKSTGLVVSSQISHATPAAFAAHCFSRHCGCEIARQYIAETGVDVILGGGVYETRSLCDVYAESFAPADKRRYIINLAKANGYAFVGTRSALNRAVTASARKILGMFEQNGYGQGKTPELFRVNPAITYPAGEPTLPEMTAVALDILEEDPDGFFLMVEGSQIDWANHAHDIVYQLAEVLSFDEAAKVVIDWLDADPVRKATTLVIVVADHECGGFAINGPYHMLSKRGDIVEAGWTSKDHTAQDTVIWSEGPKGEKLNKAVDNTDLYDVMVEALR